MSEYDYATLDVRTEGRVEWLCLNRPDPLNAINTEMVTELRDYFARKEEDTHTRVIVMGGAVLLCRARYQGVGPRGKCRAEGTGMGLPGLPRRRLRTHETMSPADHLDRAGGGVRRRLRLRAGV